MPRYGKGYEHVDDAAAAALMALEFQPRVRNQEYMGLLIRDPQTGLVYRTDFQTQGARLSAEWQGHPDGQAVGVAHNHPARAINAQGYPGTFFSPGDQATAAGMKVPSYVAAMERSGTAQQRRLRTDKNIGKPREGEEFLAQFPIDEFLQYIAAKRSRENPIAAAIINERNSIRVAGNGNSNPR